MKVFEVSWEVCNKVGGIYSVISSKVGYMQEICDYVAFGPYFESEAKKEFKELEVQDERIQKAITKAQEKGLKIHFGEWQIKNKPKVFLIEFESYFSRVDEIKKYLWERYELDSLGSNHDFNEPLVFSWAVADFIRFLIEEEYASSNDVLHAHEWMTGFSILNLKDQIKTVFTTHATMIGRTIAGNNIDLYGKLEELDANYYAKELGVIPKHSAEKTMANNSDVFTTVSDITAREAKFLLKKEVDVVLKNGIDGNLFFDENKLTKNSKKSRDKINEFLSYFFNSNQDFNPKNAKIGYFAGRYEHKNKGIDIIIDSLVDLNKQTDENFVFFFLVAINSSEEKKELLRRKALYHNLKDLKQTNFTEKKDLLENIYKSNSQPLITTYETTILLDELKKKGLDNKKENKVKVVVHPFMLDNLDSFLCMDYFETIRGFDIGVFPSYYEPWGYTPVECLVSGVLAVTTNFAGFGVHSQEKKEIVVLDRNKEYSEIVSDLKNTFLNLNNIKVKKSDYINSIRDVDWKELIKNYKKAYELTSKE